MRLPEEEGVDGHIVRHFGDAAAVSGVCAGERCWGWGVEQARSTDGGVTK